jgi:N-acetylglutamate synthase-like GNAT family acetyltransferase
MNRHVFAKIKKFFPLIAKMSVRQATFSDTEAALALLQQLGYGSTTRQFLRYLVTPNSHVCVAEEAGKVVGLIAFNTMPSLLSQPTRVVIDALVVDASYRGGGIGSQLVESMEVQVPKPCVIELSSSLTRAPSGTHAFYESRGYTVPAKRFLTKVIL